MAVTTMRFDVASERDVGTTMSIALIEADESGRRVATGASNCVKDEVEFGRLGFYNSVATLTKRWFRMLARENGKWL